MVFIQEGTEWYKRNCPLFKNSRCSVAKQFGLPMHFKLNSLNLASFLFLNPVLTNKKQDDMKIEMLIQLTLSQSKERKSALMIIPVLMVLASKVFCASTPSSDLT